MPVDPKTVAEVAVLVQAQAQARQRIAQATQAAVVAQVRLFTGWYDHPAITRLTQRLAKLTLAGQRQTASSTDAYALQVLKLMTGRRPRGTHLIDTSSGLRTVPLESVYGRLADQYRYLEASRGESAPEALLDRPAGPLVRLSEPEILDRVVLRVTLQVDDNLSLAFRDQMAADLAEAPTVTGYRRILHPELSAGGSCGLCVAAATRTYSRETLLPLHSRCACTVLPVIGDEGGDGDPGLVLNRADLKALYEAAGRASSKRSSTAIGELAKTRYAVAQNGELGPRLVAAGQHHRGPDEVAADDEIQSAAGPTSTPRDPRG